MADKSDSAGAPRTRMFICSKISGTTPAEFERNRAHMRMYARYALLQGYDPEATGDYYCNLLDDFSEAERALGLAMGRSRLEGCEWALVVHDDRGISSGMQGDIDYARAHEVKLWWVPANMVTSWLEEHDPAFARWTAQAFAHANALDTAATTSDGVPQDAVKRAESPA